MNLGMPETIFIVLLALIVFGPKRLPELAAKAGRIMADLKRASNDFTRQLTTEIEHVNVEEERKKFKDRAEELWKETKSGFSIDPPAQGGVARTLTEAGVTEAEVKALDAESGEVGDNGLPAEGAFVPPAAPVVEAQASVEAPTTPASETVATTPTATPNPLIEPGERTSELRRMASNALDELRRMAQSPTLTAPTTPSNESNRTVAEDAHGSEVVKESAPNV